MDRLPPRPAAATIVPLLALLALLVVAWTVTRDVPASPAGRLYAATQALAEDLEAGRLTRIWEGLAPEAQGGATPRRLEAVGAVVRSARWRVVNVEVEAGRSALAWEPGRRRDRGPWSGPGRDAGGAPVLVLAWRRGPDGSWRLADWAWAS